MFPCYRSKRHFLAACTPVLLLFCHIFAGVIKMSQACLILFRIIVRENVTDCARFCVLWRRGWKNNENNKKSYVGHMLCTKRLISFHAAPFLYTDERYNNPGKWLFRWLLRLSGRATNLHRNPIGPIANKATCFLGYITTVLSPRPLY